MTDKEKKAAYMRNFRATHPEYRIYMREYSKRNKDKINANHRSAVANASNRLERLAKKREESKALFLDPVKRAIILAKSAKYRSNNPEKRRETSRKSSRKHSYRRHLQRIETDANYAIKFRSAGRIRSAIKRNGGIKGGRTMELIGCTVQELRAHLESKFKPGMSWDNYGAWQIDHIIPCAEFDLRSEFQQLQCFHFSNLQPLWKLENIKKKDKLTVSYQKTLPL